MADPINDILDIGGDGGVDPAAGKEPGGGGAPKPTIDQKVSELEKSNKELADSNKNLSELVRQQAEENKPFKDFYNKVTGVKDDEDKKADAIARQQAFADDPEAATRDMIKKEMDGLENKVKKESAFNVIDRAMREIDKRFKVDWDKHSEIIVEQLKSFDKTAKKDKPVETLIKACRLAGKDILKAHTGDLPPTTIQGRRGGQLIIDDESSKIKKRVLKNSKKKSGGDNILGLPSAEKK